MKCSPVGRTARFAFGCVAGMFLALSMSAAHGFQLAELSGARTSLAAHTGQQQWTLVLFWSLDCIPCEQQKPMLETFHEAHSEGAARVLGVVIDGVEKRPEIMARLARRPAGFPHLLAYADVFNQQFRDTTGRPFRATPTYWLYNPAGELAGVHVGVLALEQLEQIVSAAH